MIDPNLKKLAWIAVAATEFGISVAAGVLLGVFLDRYLETGPWLSLFGVGVGFGVGLWLLVRLTKKV